MKARGIEQMEEIRNKLREEFLPELPDLSKGWKTPSFPVNVDMNFAKHMSDELHRGDLSSSNPYWVRYYQLSGIPPDSNEYILPLSLPHELQWSELYQQREKILEDHSAGVIWSMIRAGRKPLSLRVRRFATWLLGRYSNVYHTEEHLWYWAIHRIFLNWHLFVIDRYLGNRCQVIDDMVKCAKETQDDVMSDEIYDKIDMEERIFRREMRLLHEDAQLKIDCLYWFLTTQEIRLDTYDIERLLERLVEKPGHWRFGERLVGVWMWMYRT